MNIAQKTWCVSSSIFCAIVYGIKERRPVRIAITEVEPGTDHAQAQVQDEDGKWIWLTEFWNDECMAVMQYRENLPELVGKEPHTYYTVREFLDQQATALELENIL